MAFSRTPEYKIWTEMIRRCYNPDSTSYKYYGAKGVTVCDRWRASFANFIADMGLRPSPGHSIDRHPNLVGNYELGNCRWATDAEQRANRMANVRVEYNGESHTIAEWSAITGIKRPALYARYHRGLDPAEILAAPNLQKSSNGAAEPITLTYDGVTLTLAEWEEFTGIPKRTLNSRRVRQWSTERILTEPLDTRHSHRKT